MIIDNVNLFTATNDPIHHDTTLRIEGGEIGEIGASPEPKERCVDLDNKWVTPGFIDAHVHLSMDGRVDPYKYTDLSVPEQTAHAVCNAQNQLCAGFTTVRDCGSRANIDIGVRDTIKTSDLIGPRILGAGRPIGITGGHASFLNPWECDGTNEFRRAVRANVRDGVDLIKIIATGGVLTEGSEPGAQAMTDDEIEAVVEEAHRVGRPVAAHAHGADGIECAVSAGVDTIEHCTYATSTSLNKIESSDVGYVSTIISTVVQTTDGAVEDGIREYVSKKATDALNKQLETFRAAQERDIPVIVGTDAGTPRNPHGTSAREFEQFVSHGYDPVDALRAGTSLAASVLDVDDQVGTIESGKRADLVVLSGDPTEDITQTQDPEQVFKDGHLIAEGGELI